MENIMQQFLHSNDYRIEQAIIDGNLEFEAAQDKEGNNINQYRIRTPSFKDKILAEKEKDKLKLKLMHEDGYEFREKLIELYKKKGDDISIFDKQFEEIQEKINTKYLALAEFGKKEKNEENQNNIKKIENNINILLAQQMDLSAQKYAKLRYSIEDQCNQHHLIWLIILCTDIFNEETQTWNRLYQNMEEWEKGKENINNIIAYYAGYMFLIKGEISND